MILALSPFMIRNYLVAGKFALTTSQGGFNLYLGNNLGNPDPYYRPVPFGDIFPFRAGNSVYDRSQSPDGENDDVRGGFTVLDQGNDQGGGEQPRRLYLEAMAENAGHD
jgi:hypothetical protein